MESNSKDLSRQENWVSLKSYKDEVTYNKIRRHLTDINDIISEDDIRNVKIFAFNSDSEISVASNQVKKTIN